MPEPERRIEERYPPAADTYCSFVSPIAVDFGPAKIKNLSREGIGLLITKKVEVGSQLAVNINKSTSLSKLLLVRVAHVTVLPGGTHLVGGTFENPLTYDELRTLIF